MLSVWSLIHQSMIHVQVTYGTLYVERGMKTVPFVRTGAG